MRCWLSGLSFNKGTSAHLRSAWPVSSGANTYHRWLVMDMYVSPKTACQVSELYVAAWRCDWSISADPTSRHNPPSCLKHFPCSFLDACLA